MVSKARKVISELTTLQGSSIGDVASLKVGDWVVYKDGHPLAGTTAIIHSTHPEIGTLDIFVGKALKAGVGKDDLMQIPIPSVNKGDSSSQTTSPSTVASAPKPSTHGDEDPNPTGASA